MATRIKNFVPNATYFITFSVQGKKKIFVNDKYCRVIYKWFDFLRHEYDNSIYGYVIMPNHLHLLLKVSEASPKLATLVMNGKRFMTYELAAMLKQDRQFELLEYFKIRARTKDKAKHRLFTDRYDSLLIHSYKFFLQKINYIHLNPMKKEWNLADKAENYKYSSASNYLLGRGYYDVDIIDF